MPSRENHRSGRGAPVSGGGRLRAVFVVLVLFLVLSLRPAAAEEIGQASVLQARLDGAESLVLGGRSLPLEELQALYSARNYRPLWVDKDGLTPRGRVARRTLVDAFDEGLNPAHYFVTDIEARNAPRRPSAIVELDLLLSAGLITYLGDLTEGRLAPHEHDPLLFAKPQAPDRLHLLDGLAESPDLAAALAALAPPHAQYRALKTGLARYRELADRGGWPKIPEGPKLELGAQGPRVLALRQRLAVTDDAPLGGPDDALFDDALLQAVERAQARHGLVVDGVAGRNTLAALNRSVEDRIRDIQMNMERWRWLPRDLGRLHLFINIADFRLQVVNDGAVDLEMPVIVGRPYRRTPIFSNKLRYLEINPTWTVPPRIAGRDLLPKIRQDPEFLAAQGFEVYSGWSAEAVTLDPASIDWQAVSPDRFPYKLKQRPGPTNAMGRVKFMLPNSYDIYLHDTPNHDLFDRTQRTFSSGCVRLSDPRALADYLLTFLPGWDMARLDAVWEGGNQTRVNLSETIPVHFAYFTVLADSTGRLAFRRDVYGRDTTLLEALRDQLVI